MLLGKGEGPNFGLFVESADLVGLLVYCVGLLCLFFFLFNTRSVFEAEIHTQSGSVLKLQSKAFRSVFPNELYLTHGQRNDFLSIQEIQLLFAEIVDVHLACFRQDDSKEVGLFVFILVEHFRDALQVLLSDVVD